MSDLIKNNKYGLKKHYWVLTNKWGDMIFFFETRKLAMGWAKDFLGHPNNSQKNRAYKVRIVKVRK